MEDFVGLVENVQAKPRGHLTLKNCDLIFTTTRLLVVNRGASSFVSGMLGGALGGVGGAMVAGQASQERSEGRRAKDLGKSFDELLAQDEGNMSIPHVSVRSGSFKTGFFTTFWIMAPLTLEHGEGRFFGNVPYGDVEKVKACLEAVLPGVKVS